MSFDVINNPAQLAKTGFTNAQFKKLDDLYCRAAAAKILTYRTVECDFDEGVASYTYYQSQTQTASYKFVISKLGPQAMMYEVYKAGSGRIAKSGVFERAYEKLRAEIESILSH
jgi:hypothetical protein